MPSIEGVRIENGMVVGAALLGIHEETFIVCSVEEYEAMTEEEADKALTDAAFDAGKLEIYFKSDD